MQYIACMVECLNEFNVELQLHNEGSKGPKGSLEVCHHTFEPQCRRLLSCYGSRMICARIRTKIDENPKPSDPLQSRREA